jgi:hypothetical protein
VWQACQQVNSSAISRIKDQRDLAGIRLLTGARCCFVGTKTAQHNSTTKSRTKMPKKNAFLSVDLFLGLNYAPKTVW